MECNEAATMALVGLVYDAVLEPDRWGDVLQTLMRMLSATSATFWSHPPAKGDIEFFFASGVDPGTGDAYERYDWAKEIWVDRGGSAPTGSIHTGRDLTSDEDLVGSEFCNDFLKKHGLNDFATLIVANQPDRLATLSLMRSKRVPRFERSELGPLEAVAPHIGRAVSMQSRLRASQAAAVEMEGLLHQLPIGLCILDRGGRVTRLNRAAEKITNANDGVTIRQGRIAIAAGDGRVAFEKHLYGLLAVLNKRLAAPNLLGAGVVVERPSGRQGYRLALTPSPRRATTAPGDHGSVAVWIQDPEQRNVPRIDLLRQLYRLSVGEAALVASIVAGRELADIAAARGVERSTVVTQLKRVYLKTGMNRQRDLMQIWAGMPMQEPV